MYTLESYIMFDDIEFCKKITIEDASSESDLDIVKADNTLLDAPWRQSFQKELKTIMTTQIYVANKQVKNFYEEVISKYYNGLNKLDINSIESDTLVLPIVWNFLYEKNKERKQAVTSTLLTDTALLTNNNIHPTKVSAAKDNTEHNLDTQEGIRKAIEDDIRCNDVTQPWPSSTSRQRTPRQRTPRKRSTVQKDRIKLDKEIDKIDEGLMIFFPRVNNKITGLVNKDRLKEIYQDFATFKRNKQEAIKLREIQDKYDKRLENNADEIQRYKLPNLKLDDAWDAVELQDLDNTIIHYPIKVLKKKGSHSVFFGKNNFIIKCGNIKNLNEVKKLLQGSKEKTKKRREDLEINVNKTILFDKDTVAIKDFEKSIGGLKTGLQYLKLKDNGSLEVNEMNIKDKKPEFLKLLNKNQETQELNDEQAFIVQQKPQNWLIFHDPGVGKTLNALAVAINNLEGKGNIHIVAPSKSILTQWQKTLKAWINPAQIKQITLTTQTQAMFIIVCSNGSKGSFYDCLGNNTSTTGIFDDLTLNEITLDNKKIEWGPNVEKLLKKSKKNFDDLFLKDSFLQDFVRTFWSYCFLFESNNVIYFYANVVYERPKNIKKATDEFRPINQSDIGQDNRLKKTSFEKFFSKIKEKRIPEINKDDFLKTDEYVDYGKIKIAIINENIEKFDWNRVPNKDPIEYFPMLGKNTILIIDESHNVVSSNLDKKSVRFISDVGRHCKHIICCSATPFNAAEDIQKQMYLYGRILNRDPIHYFNMPEKQQQILLLGLDLVRNKVTGKKKVTDDDEQKRKINNVLKRLTIKGKEDIDIKLKNTIKSNQDLLFRRLNYDFFDLFKPISRLYEKGTRIPSGDNIDAGLDETNKQYISLSSEMQTYVADKDIDFAKRRILYRQLQNIFKIDDTGKDNRIYPNITEKVIMFHFKKERKNKRFSKIEPLRLNDYKVAYDAVKKKDYKSIDRKWNALNSKNTQTLQNAKEDLTGKILYSDLKQTNEKDHEDEKNLFMTVFNNVGNINPKIFVPDLIPSKIRFMVEEALENIILNHKNVMIYSRLKRQNKYTKEVFKMYNVQEIIIVADEKKSTEQNVIATLEQAKIIKNRTLIDGVGFKLQLKWTSEYWDTSIEENGDTFASRDKSKLEKKLNLTKVTGINIALTETIRGYNDVVNNINDNTEGNEKSILEAKKKKSKIWKQRILGKDALPYYIAKPIDGDVKEVEQRKVIEELFNIGILDICLISDAGAQGTDFKSTRESMMYVASTGNEAVPAKIMQFKGRLNRKYSHKACPPEKQNVTYTRLCLYKSLKANKEECGRMSHFFYYKVPQKGYAINFSYSTDFANKDFPEKCPFCNLLISNEAGESCKCKVKAKKQYYYIPDIPYETLPELLKNKGENDCKEFKIYERFLNRLLNVNLVTLLLKTESVEHNYFAEDILKETNGNSMRFMAIKEDDYWYFKRICYKGKLPIDINDQPNQPNQPNRQQSNQQIRRLTRSIKDDENKSSGLSDSDKIDGKPNTRGGSNRNSSGRGTSGGGRGGASSRIQKQKDLPRTKEDLKIGMRIDVTFEKEDETIFENVTYGKDEAGNEIVTYKNMIYNKDKEGNESVFWYDDKSNTSFDSKNDPWQYSDIPEVGIETKFEFKDKPGKIFKIVENLNNHIFRYVENGKNNTIKQMEKMMNSKREQFYPLNLWYHTIKIVKSSTATSTTTTRLSKRLMGQIQKRYDKEDFDSDNESEDDNYDEDWENNEEDYDGDDDLIHEPVDSIVATYPYLSLE